MWKQRWTKVLVFVASLGPIFWLCWRAWHQNLTPNPIEYITRYTGDWTIRFIVFTLAVTPLRKVLGLPDLIRFRRMIGLYAFFYGTLHFITYIWLDKFFDLPDMLKDVAKRPFITAGFTAFLLMVPLALTSTTGWIRRMGGKRWQLLHRLVYLSGIAGVVHYYWLVKSDIRLPAMYGAMVQERMVNHGQSQTAATATVAQLLGAAGLDLSKGVVGTYDAGIDLSLPQTIGAGATYRPAAGWLLAFEGGWMGWSKAEHDMPFKLTNGNNTNLNLLINGNATNASFTYPFPLRWKDSWIGKAGVEKTVGDGAVRLGWAYGSNPVPDNALFITFPAIVEHSAIVGGTIKVGGMPLDIAFVHAFNKTMTAASTSLVGSEYRNSVTDLQENVLTVGTVVHF